MKKTRITMNLYFFFIRYTHDTFKLFYEKIYLKLMIKMIDNKTNEFFHNNIIVFSFSFFSKHLSLKNIRRNNIITQTNMLEYLQGETQSKGQIYSKKKICNSILVIYND